MSFFDIFKASGPSDQQQQQQPAAPQPNHTGSAPNTPDGKMEGTDQGEVNPLDAYAKLFEKTEADANTPPSFTIDPAVLSDVSSKMSFTQGIPPELMQQATSGDVNALIQIINASSQNAYKAALSHSSALTDKFVGARTQHEMKGVNSLVKQELTNSALASTTPNYNHPVVKKQLNMVADSLQAQHPDATPQEIASMAANYIKELAQAVAPNQPSQQQQEAAAGTDWAAYLTR